MITKAKLFSELTFQTARSGGAGGQNVNKVETKVEVYWDVINSAYLNEAEKAMLQAKLKSKIDTEGNLKMASSKTRSQLKNKEDVVEKLHRLIVKSLTVDKKRIATNVPYAAKRKRLDAKKKNSDIKKSRSNTTHND